MPANASVLYIQIAPSTVPHLPHLSPRLNSTLHRLKATSDALWQFHWVAQGFQKDSCILHCTSNVFTAPYDTFRYIPFQSLFQCSNATPVLVWKECIVMLRVLLCVPLSSFNMPGNPVQVFWKTADSSEALVLLLTTHKVICYLWWRLSFSEAANMHLVWQCIVFSKATV